jgi:hypothetical protein
MRNTTFMKNLALTVAFVFLLTAVPVFPVFADTTKVKFTEKPTYARGETETSNLKSIGLQITVSADTSSPQAISIILVGPQAEKFYLTKDENMTRSAVSGSAIRLEISTESAITTGGLDWEATAYIGIVSGLTLKAGDSITIEAMDENNPNCTDRFTITIPSGGGGGGGGGTKPPDKPATPPDSKPDTGTGAWSSPFHDVKPTDWFYKDVEYVLKNGLFTGTSANTFSPNTHMTRGMIVTVLGRLHKIDAGSSAGSSFNDVASGQYYTAYVEWAKVNGIVNGVGGNMFAPDREVSRQDFAVILLRYAEFARKTIPSTRQAPAFADEANIAGYAKNAIRSLYSGAIINGVGGNTINPEGSATRAEVAAMVHRFATTVNDGAFPNL